MRKAAVWAPVCSGYRRYRWRLKLKYRCRMPRSNTHLKPRLWLYSLEGGGAQPQDVSS